MVPKPLSKTIHFVLPDDKDQPSGGNIYNARLILALRQMGQDVAEVSFSDYCSALAAEEVGVFGVDSLFVNDLQSLSFDSVPSVFSFFILHHLESLHPAAGQEAEVLFQQERKVLERFDLILTTSEFSRQYLVNKGIGVPIIVVEPALSAPSQAMPREIHSTLRGLMVANVVERKGILAYLEALIQLGTEDDDFLLNIIGRQDMEPDYFQECQRLLNHSVFKDKITFMGALTHEQTLAQYQKHHLLVSAAQMETFGMAIQEARGAGLALLVLSGGYSSHHVHEQNGKLCTDIFELAGNFLQFSRDKEKLQAFLKSASTVISVQEPYHWEQAAALFLQKIRNFL